MSLHADFKTAGDNLLVWCNSHRRWKLVLNGYCVGCGADVRERLTA